jgi:hypothetical protein
VIPPFCVDFRSIITPKIYIVKIGYGFCELLLTRGVFDGNMPIEPWWADIVKKPSITSLTVCHLRGPTDG